MIARLRARGIAISRCIFTDPFCSIHLARYRSGGFYRLRGCGLWLWPSVVRHDVAPRSSCLCGKPWLRGMTMATIGIGSLASRSLAPPRGAAQTQLGSQFTSTAALLQGLNPRNCEVTSSFRSLSRRGLTGVRALMGTSGKQQRVEPGPGQESVWDYPRPPSLQPVPERIRIEFNSKTIADTTRAYRVLETSHPPG